MGRSRRALLGLAAMVAALPVLGVVRTAGPAEADGTPDPTVTVSGPSRALLGTSSTVTLRACNSTATDGYNLSFRAVLPAGTGYVSGAPAPSAVINGAPLAGQTTVLFDNVSDLLAGACSSVSVQVANDPDNDAATLPVGSTYAVTGGAYVNTDPFSVPDFDAQGQPIAGPSSYTGFATATGPTTTVTAFTVATAAGSLAEGELLRGVHGDRPRTSTITVTNNARVATADVTVVEVLPPGLEFLGCTDYLADSTTSAPTNPGSTEEYLGAGPLAGGTPSATCRTPSTIETLDAPTLLADASTAPAGSTRITWSAGSLGTAADLAPGASLVITYLAGIPARANTATWTGATPSAASLQQGRNLDNNSGPLTTELTTEATLTTRSAATATFTGPTTGGPSPTLTETSSAGVSAEDLTVHKSMTGQVVQGTVLSSTLVVRTGEYRDVFLVAVTDTLPDGACPLGTLVSGPAADPTCAPSGTDPTIDAGTGAVAAPYSSATENADGTWTLVWDPTDHPDLAALPAGSTVTIVFTSRVRATYRDGGADATPVLTNDTMTNAVSVNGLSDPHPSRPDTTDADTAVGDVSSASVSGIAPTIAKQVSVRTGPLADGAGLTTATVPDVCAGGTVTWTDEPSVATGYRSGDMVCFDLQASFPSGVDSSGVRILDDLPAGYSYVAGSARRVTAFDADTLTGTTVSVSGSTLSFDVSGDGTVPNDGHRFHWTFAVQVGLPDGRDAGDIIANVQRMAFGNTAGEVFQLRDQALAEWGEPELALVKGIRSISGATASSVAGPLPANTDGRTVQAGDAVTYRIDITNAGNVAASQVEVWDELPAGVVCADVSAISDGGTCPASPGDRIVWEPAAGVSVAASATTTLTYVVTVPADADPSRSYVNTAGVRSYTATTNTTPGSYTYVPASNIDPGAPSANTAAAHDASSIALTGPTVVKLQQSEIGEAGNTRNGTFATSNEQATIGEVVRYRVTATIPEGTTVYDAQLTDTLPTGVVFDGNATVSGSDPALAGSALGVPAGGSGGTISVTLPTPYTNAADSGDDTVTVEFDARIADIVGNTRGTNRDNRGRFSWNDVAGTARTPVDSAAARVTIVEPRLGIAKADDTGGTASPGETVGFTLTVSNTTGGNGSSGHDLAISDVLPAGLTVTDGGVPVADGGTVGPDNGTWTAATRTITWPTAGPIAPGATIVRRYDARVDDPAPAASTLVNTAQVTGTSLAGADPDERTSYLATDANTLTLPAPAVVKSFTASTGTIGTVVEARLDVTVPAGTTIHDAAVLDDWPAGLAFVAYGTATVQPGSDIACPAPTAFSGLEPVDTGSGTTRSAWWLGDVTAPTSGNCTYRLTLTARVLPAAAGTPVVSGSTLVNSARIGWNDADRTVGVPLEAPAIGTFDRAGAASTASVTVAEPQTRIDKDVTEVGCDATLGNIGDDDDCPTRPGRSYTFQVRVTNSGNWPAYDVTVTDTVPALLTGVVVATGASHTVADDWSAGDPDVRWTVPGPIAPGGSITLSYTAELTPSATLSAGATVTNTAAAPTAYGVEEATRTANPTVTYRAYDAGSDTVTLTVATPSVAIAKSAVSDATDARTTADFTWELVATNATGVTVDDAFDVDVTDTLPAGWVYVANSARVTTPYVTAAAVEPACAPACAAGAVLSFPDVVSGVAQPLAPGASVTVRLAARPGAPLLAEGTTGAFAHTNTGAVVAADVTGATGDLDGPYGGPDDTASATIRRIDLSLTKAVSAGPHYYGALADYTVTVSNAGPDDATGVAVDEILPAGLQYVSTVSTSQGSYTSGTGRWTVGGLADGASATLVVRTRFTATGTITNVAAVAAADQWDADSTPGNQGAAPAEDDTDDVTVTAVPSSLGDRVWYDVDADGVDDVGEPGIAGVTVVLEAAGNDATFGTADDFHGPDGAAGTADDLTTTSTVTGPTGSYGFTGLPVGQYRTRVTTASLPAGLRPSYNDDGTSGPALDDRSGTVTLTTDAPQLGLDFGYTGTGSLGDTVWYDRDGDGTAVTEAGEPGLAGIATTLVWAGSDATFGTADDVTHPSRTTDGAGAYSYPNLPAGAYRLTVDSSLAALGLSPSYDLDGIGTPGTVAMSLTAGQDRTDVDFSYTGTAALGDRVWLDHDADATADPGEPGIGGVVVLVTWPGVDTTLGTADDVQWSITTDGSGAYGATNLPAGVFRVALDPSSLPAGTAPTHDLDGIGTARVASVSLVAGETRTDVDFGEAGVHDLGDLVFLDLDGNGAAAPGAGEPGLPGVTVTVVWAGRDATPGTADDVSRTAVTGAGGTYTVANLPSGSYTVTISGLPTGTAPTYDLDGTGTARSAVLSLTGDRIDVDFAERGTGSIGDLVFTDRDADGAVDLGDDGLADVDLTVTWYGRDGSFGTADDLVLSERTASDGSYLAERLPAGTYRVVVDPASIPTGMVAVSELDPTADGVVTTTLVGGQERLDVDFGYREQADLQLAKNTGGRLAVGVVASYTLTVGNLGPAVAAAPQVVDTLPTGLTFRSGTGSGWTCSAAAAIVTCTAASALAVSASSTITITADVAAAAAPTAVNTATVSSTTADPVTSNNTATVSSPVDYADLSVSKQAVTAVVRGQDVTYRIAVSNAGPSTAPAGIVVTDPLPPVLAFVSAAGDGWTCTNDNGTVRCTASAPIPVGSTSTFTLVARVATNATGSVANTAVLSGTVTPGDTLPPTGGITDPSAANNTVVANNTIAASLPGTGSASYRMATLAGLLVAFGAIALVGTRRRRLA